MRILSIMFLLVVLLSSISYAVDDKSLVFYCPFEEGSGNTTKDIKSGLVGEFKGGAKWTADGKVGKAIEFTDAASAIEFPEDSVMDITDEITMEAWVLPNAVQADSGIMGRRDSANVGGYCMQWTNGMFEMWMHIGGWQGTRDKQTVKPKPGEWHHIACVYSGSEELQYVDGELDTKFNQSGKLGSVKQPFRVGQAQTGLSSVIGLIDEVAVYKRALTEDEVKMDMTKGIFSPVSPAGNLVTCWGKLKAN